MPKMWGNLQLSKNGRSHMSFNLHFELTQTVDGEIQR